jgi:hypothetical protein
LATLSVVAQSRALFHPFATFLAKITLAREGDILDEANVQDVAFGLACADFQALLSRTRGYVEFQSRRPFFRGKPTGHQAARQGRLQGEDRGHQVRPLLPGAVLPI